MRILSARMTQFGWKPPDAHRATMRSRMWRRIMEWLQRGAIDRSDRREVDLIAPGNQRDNQDRVFVERRRNTRRNSASAAGWESAGESYDSSRLREPTGHQISAGDSDRQITGGRDEWKVNASRFNGALDLAYRLTGLPYFAYSSSPDWRALSLRSRAEPAGKCLLLHSETRSIRSDGFNSW